MHNYLYDLVETRYKIKHIEFVDLLYPFPSFFYVFNSTIQIVVPFRMKHQYIMLYIYYVILCYIFLFNINKRSECLNDIILQSSISCQISYE